MGCDRLYFLYPLHRIQDGTKLQGTATLVPKILQLSLSFMCPGPGSHALCGTPDCLGPPWPHCSPASGNLQKIRLQPEFGPNLAGSHSNK